MPSQQAEHQLRQNMYQGGRTSSPLGSIEVQTANSGGRSEAHPFSPAPKGHQMYFVITSTAHEKEAKHVFQLCGPIVARAPVHKKNRPASRDRCERLEICKSLILNCQYVFCALCVFSFTGPFGTQGQEVLQMRLPRAFWGYLAPKARKSSK